jgi:phenylalanine-4-hydroxylase
MRIPMNRQDAVIASIPSYLRQFVVHQHYDEYTPQDHAVWRYVMRRNIDFLKSVAHPAYIDGLEKTGIGLEYIPHIDEMNDRLSKIGWKAVVVDGFVPPAAFMEFQAHKILVISAEIRNFKNILYTPAPDIIHEAAGHAPIIADETYSTYLQRIGEYGAKSVFSKLDYEIYEAIRMLSIIKEYPDATSEEVEKAERELEEKVAANTKPSESAYLARLHWWTVEYGLIGKPNDFKIYGAGILSSVGESEACLSPTVEKIPLSAECTKYDYDITKMQPQLFVAESFEHLLQVLEDFADSMCFRKGGAESARKVIASENVGTMVLSSGLQISGVFTEVLTDSNDKEYFIRTIGSSALATNDRHLDGHGTDYHADGFSSPIGLLKNNLKPLEDWSSTELENNGIIVGNKTVLEFESGIIVKGIVQHITKDDGKVVLITFTECAVTANDCSILFNPSWGNFDMAVGTRIVSAYSGSADKENFNVYPPKSEKKAIKVRYTDNQKTLFTLYSKLENYRKSDKVVAKELQSLYDVLKTQYPDNWLIRLELLELSSKLDALKPLISEIHDDLEHIASANEETADLIQAGVKFIKTPLTSAN